jgi:hypothetical protein
MQECNSQLRRWQAEAKVEAHKKNRVPTGSDFFLWTSDYICPKLHTIALTPSMNVLIACEYSGKVRDAFSNLGHFAVSCDILPSESPGLHYQRNVLELLDMPWDLLVGFPPCTYLCKAQAGLMSSPGRKELQSDAFDFFQKLYSAPIPRIALENPVGYLSTHFRQPDQITSFHHFGDPYQKEICLWLKNLHPLKPTNYVPGSKSVSNHVNSRMSQAQKSKIKSKFFSGIANAMAEQWGAPPQQQLSIFEDLKLRPQMLRSHISYMCFD